MDIQQTLTIEQARYIHRNFPTALLGGLVVGTLLAAVFWGVASTPLLAGWIIFTVLLTGWRLIEWRGFRGGDFTPASAARWLRLTRRGALISGLGWGGAGWLLLFPEQQLAHQLLLIYAVTMMSTAAMFSYGAHAPTFLAYHLTASLPALIILTQQKTLQQIAIVFGFLLFGAVLLRALRSFNRMFIDSLRLRFENAELVQQLILQKEAAEAANLAKSRFLAAASHDLRQPMHALNLYLGAFAGFSLPPAALPLFAKVRQCAQTMDEMFRALLDISRLDASAVQPELRDFAIAPLLERIRVEFEPQARARNLELRVVPCSAYAYSDPSLVERILRNLITNAVRYTEHGKILIGCRRRGERLCFVVYDTGLGIEANKQRLVFEEFYQIGNAERDRNKGLGLGLAIVNRLTRLLGSPVKLASQFGVGSMFVFDVPRVLTPQLTHSVAGTIRPHRGSLAGALVVVIDDEEMILDAAQTLLQQWGCTVIAAISGVQALERLSDSTRVPDALICDFRLRDEENGIDVIEALRTEFNADIPALLLTGDTAPERIQMIANSGFPVLHKPLHEEELAQALTELVDARDSTLARNSGPAYS